MVDEDAAVLQRKLGDFDDWPLIGRQSELHRTRLALVDPRYVGVAVVGEPGMGKTRISDEIGRHLARYGWAPMWLSGMTPTPSVPFSPFAELLPDLSMDGSRSQKLEMLRATAEELRRQSSRRRPLLVIDDAHLLDQDSAALAYYLVTTRVATLLCTLRTGVEVPPQIEALWRDELAVRVELPPLSPAEVADLAESILGGVIDSASLTRLVEISRGVPLYVRELLLHASEAGDLTQVDGMLHASWPGESARLEQLIRTRLGEIEAPQRRLVEMLAVGEPLERTIVEQAGSAEDLRTLSARGLVRTYITNRRENVELAHPLYGETLRAELDPMTTATRRREVGAALAATGAHRRGDVLRVTALGISPDEAHFDTNAFVNAARDALRRLAFPQAVQLAGAALAAGGGGDAFQVLSSASWVPGAAPPDLGSMLRDAADDRSRAVAAIDRIHQLVESEADLEAAEAVFAAAVSEIVDRDWRDLVLATWAEVLWQQQSYTEAEMIADPLVSQDRGTEMAVFRAAPVAGDCWNRAGRSIKSRQLLTRLLPLTLSQEDVLVDDPYRVAAELFMNYISAGDLEPAGELLDEARQTLGDALGERGRRIIDLGNAWIALARGRPLSAAHLLRGALDGELPFEFPPWAFAMLAQSRALTGDGEGAEDALRRAEEVVHPLRKRLVHELLVARPWVALVCESRSSAQSAARSSAVEAESIRDAPTALRCWHDLARFGEPAEAAERLLILAATVDQAWAPLLTANASALATGDAGALEQCAASFEERGFELLATESWCAAAARHVSRSARKAHARAVSRASRLLARCEGARTPLTVDGPGAGG